MEVKLYVATHKSYNQVQDQDLYIPILVGADKNIGEKNYLRDNQGDNNISDRNFTFCELTGLYWIWKNSKDDIVGLCHYRRYFGKNKRFLKQNSILKKNDILKQLNDYDVILPSKSMNEYNGYTAEEFFNKNHDHKVWEMCRQIISENNKDYLDAFNWFSKEKTGYCYNMFIMSREMMDEYCSWLFPILFELDKKIDYSRYDSYNTRMIGFVAERLINVWVHKKQLTVKEFPVFSTEEPGFLQRIQKKLFNK
uniref:Putative glycosyl transferase n=1 Tax=Streptococcus pneumoniae TaxID=1313 RepID=Q4K1H3_STREE|nr:putative glycosyl transferase [Streptococcus pneumoniae]